MSNEAWAKTLKTKYGITANVVADASKMDRETWLQHREKGIGGSDIGTIMGLNKYKTGLSLWMERCGTYSDGFQGNEATEAGAFMEDAIAEFYKQKNPEHQVVKLNAILQHPEFPFALANLDRLVCIDGVWGVGEIKNVSTYVAKDWDVETGTVPPSYYAQGQWYLAVTGLPFVQFIPFIGGNQLKPVYVERDDAFITAALEDAAVFMDNVATKTMPDLSKFSGHVNLPEDIANLHDITTTESETLVVDDSELLKARLEKLSKLKDEKKVLDAAIKEEQAMIVLTLRGADDALDENGAKLFTYRKSKDTKKLDGKRLKAEDPELWDKYAVHSPGSRRFNQQWK